MIRKSLTFVMPRPRGDRISDTQRGPCLGVVNDFVNWAANQEVVTVQSVQATVQEVCFVIPDSWLPNDEAEINRLHDKFYDEYIKFTKELK